MKGMMYPPYIQWEVSPECNHNCIHCYNYWRKTGEKFDKCENHLSIAKAIVRNHPISVVITGGEPLLVFDSIKESIKLLKKEKIVVSINTNATLVTETIAKFLAENEVTTLVSLPCGDASICDKITNVEGSLKRITKGVKLLQENGVKVTLNMVVSKQNIGYIHQTAEYAKNILHIDRFFASKVSKPINSNSDFNKVLLSKTEVEHLCKELIHIENNLGLHVDSSTPIPACVFTEKANFDKFAYARNCTAGKTSYAVDCLGNIKACPRDSVIYGNILKDNFGDVWEKMEEWREEKYLPKECKNCNVKKQCGGGCRLDAYPITGKKDSLDPIADIDNLPVTFNKKQSLSMYTDEQKFVVAEELTIIKENGGWRANVGRNFMVITDALKAFLITHTKFCLSEFIQEFNVEYDLANKALNKLASKHIINAV